MFQAQKQGNCLNLCLKVCKYCSIPLVGTNFNTALIIKTPVDSKQSIRRTRKVKYSTYPKTSVGIIRSLFKYVLHLGLREMWSKRFRQSKRFGYHYNRYQGANAACGSCVEILPTKRESESNLEIISSRLVEQCIRTDAKFQAEMYSAEVLGYAEREEVRYVSPCQLHDKHFRDDKPHFEFLGN